MGIQIVGANGKNIGLGVDGRGRGLTATLSESESNYATTLGLKYNINTGNITLTSDAKTTVIYVKNNDNRDIIIDSLIYNLLNTTGGTGNVFIEVVRNPTTGGIITNANNVLVGSTDNANLNFGSTNTANILAYKGATGETVVNGGVCILTGNPTPTGRILISPGGGVILTKGNSIGINYTPPVGNTSQVVQFALNAYVKESV